MLIFLPYFGIFCILLYGQGYKLRRPIKLWLRKTKTIKRLEDFSFSNNFNKSLKWTNQSKNIFHFCKNISDHPLYYNTKVNLIFSKYQKFKLLEKDFLQAQHYIYINYYLFREGECLDWFCELLLKVLNRGVKVYIIFEFFSLSLFSQQLKKLLHAGIKIANRGKKSYFIHELFYANHRKSIVVDGNVGYIGGFNIGDEHANLSDSYGVWEDAHVRIQGKSVKSVESIFLKDWLFLTDEILKESYQNANNGGVLSKFQYDNLACFIDETPRSHNSSTKDLFHCLITQAQQRITIVTPYFFIDNEINKALQNAALMGVRVEIYVPELNSPKIALDLSRLYYSALIKAGVKFYEFSKAYIHAKIILIDQNIVSIGSCNMDYRSFYFSSEITMVLDDPTLVKNIDKQFFARILPSCNLISENPLKHKSKMYVLILKFMSIAAMFF